MTTRSLEVSYPHGQPRQGTNEAICYVIDVSEWSRTVSSPAVTEVIDESDGSDVIATVMPNNAPSASWPNITLGLLRNLTAGKSYRVECSFVGGNSQLHAFHLRIRGI